jgi:hypothetical protein
VKKIFNEETVKIPVELAKRIQVELKMTPGLDLTPCSFKH